MRRKEGRMVGKSSEIGEEGCGNQYSIHSFFCFHAKDIQWRPKVRKLLIFWASSNSV